MARVASHIKLRMRHNGLLITESAVFPPQNPATREHPKRLAFPLVIHTADPPLHAERHLPNSIATLRRRRIVGLLPHPPPCPCCGSGRMAASSPAMPQQSGVRPGLDQDCPPEATTQLMQTSSWYCAGALWSRMRASCCPPAPQSR